MTVEEEGDIAKFKDYKPSASDANTASGSSAPATPKKEIVEEPVSSPEPKTSKPTVATPAEDRVFSSPLARKLAEEQKVSYHKFYDHKFCSVIGDI